MNTTHLHLLARCTLWMGALLLVTSSFAAPQPQQVAEADALLRQGDLPGAMALLRKAADAQDPVAQARLGDLLRSAEFEAEAVVLYRKSAEQGEAAGEYGLGRAYADGAGVKKDPALALDLYRKAEQKNFAPALSALAKAYRTGTLGLAADVEKARTYEQKAAELAATAPKEYR
jgi:TPR repeat protein